MTSHIFWLRRLFTVLYFFAQDYIGCNAAFHKAKKLKIPKNIVLIFQPTCNPELNPAEKIWAKFKRNFTNKVFRNLDEISDFIQQQVTNLTKKEVIDITKFDYIKPCLAPIIHK